MSGTISKRTCGCVDKQDQRNLSGILLELTKWMPIYLPIHRGAVAGLGLPSSVLVGR